MGTLIEAFESHPWFTWTAVQESAYIAYKIKPDWEAIDTFFEGLYYSAHKYWQRVEVEIGGVKCL